MDLRTYAQATRTGTYGFLAALPLLLLYEGLILFVNRDAVAPVRVGADIWIKESIRFLGGSGMLILGVIVLLAGAGIVFAERKKPIPIRAGYFAGIVGESLVYALVVAFLVSGLIGAIFGMALGEAPAAVAQAAESLGTGTMLVLSIGAGLYEELVFRVLLVGGLFWILKRTFDRETSAYIVAAIVGALLFSTVHYIGALGDPFTLWSFSFRFVFGLALNAIFLLRGFAVAAWTHSLYDVLVVTQLLG